MKFYFAILLILATLLGAMSGAEEDCSSEHDTFQTQLLERHIATTPELHSLSSSPSHTDHFMGHLCHLGHCPALIERAFFSVGSYANTQEPTPYVRVFSSGPTSTLFRPPIV